MWGQINKKRIADKMAGVRQLGFRPQRENIYNGKLPRQESGDKDSNLYLQEIKLNLSNAVLNNDISQGALLIYFQTWSSKAISTKCCNQKQKIHSSLEK